MYTQENKLDNNTGIVKNEQILNLILRITEINQIRYCFEKNESPVIVSGIDHQELKKTNDTIQHV